MTTRLEKYYERKKRKKKSKYRKLLILCLFLILIGGLFIVDNSFRCLMCIEDKSIFDYDYDNRVHNLHLFGENHYIKQDNIDSIITDVKEGFNSVKNKIEIIVKEIRDKIIK